MGSSASVRGAARPRGILRHERRTRLCPVSFSRARGVGYNFRMAIVSSTRFVLVRHAATAAGAARMSGRSDTPLSDGGRRQVARLAARIAAGPPFDAIYTSPLSRAVETARALGAARPCAALQEIDCGVVDGAPVDEVRSRHGELWAANLAQDDEDFRWPGGESYRELRRRCVAAIARLAARHRGGRVAVVTHAGVISQVIGAIHGRSAAAWEPFRPGNASLTVVDWGDDGGALVSFDDRAHLDAD
jgi:alpha-ribazole phosphatase/probable phosphoglycerate mutase